jgi:hypothetical protein
MPIAAPHPHNDIKYIKCSMYRQFILYHVAFVMQFAHNVRMDSGKPAQRRMPFVTTEDQLERIDRWRGQLLPIPSRNEAIKRLVDFGLDAQAKAAETPK